MLETDVLMDSAEARERLAAETPAVRPLRSDSVAGMRTIAILPIKSFDERQAAPGEHE